MYPYSVNKMREFGRMVFDVRKKSKKIILPAAFMVLISSFSPVMAADAVEETLNEVVVRSTPLSDYLVTTEIITAKKIKERGATNLAEAIKMVPGLFVNYGGKASQLVNIRGAATDQTKIYIDGMPVFPMSGIASNSASTLEQISVDNIEKIEIIKGPGPVQYGTDYKGGIILITTKNGQGAGQGTLNLSAGSHSSFNNSVSYSGSERNTSYYFNAGRNTSDGYLNNTEASENTFNGKIKWNFGKTSALTLSGYYMDADRQISNDYDQRTGREITDGTCRWSGYNPATGKNKNHTAADWKFTDFKQTNIALQFDQNADSRFNYNVKLYHVTDGNDLWVHNLDVPAAPVDPYNPVWYRSGWHSNGTGAEFTGNLQTAGNNTVTFGTKYKKIKWTSDENNSNLDEAGNDKRTNYFVQNNWKIDDKTEMTVGVNYEKVNQDYHKYQSFPTVVNKVTGNPTLSATDPVFNITRKLNQQDTVRFSAGKTHIFVMSKQLATNLSMNMPIPNAERANNYEVGWKHKLDKRSSLDIAAFQNKISDRIDKINDSTNPNNGSYYNIARTEIKGLELQYNQEFSHRLQGFVNYTYQNAHDYSQAGVDTRAVGLPQTMFNYGFTYTVDKLQAVVLGHFLGDVRTNNTTYPNLNNYHLVDLNFNYHESKNIDYFLHINNVFDVNYWETATYPGEGINFRAGVTIKF